MQRQLVSIHAPRTGCDSSTVSGCVASSSFQFTHPARGATVKLLRCASPSRFQFTHPVWGATGIGQLHLTLPNVSIHAPRVGCDDDWRSRPSATCCFNSRTPCGVRLIDVIATISSNLFQFTHPVWGATVARLACLVVHGVSIHAPRVGCDPCSLRYLAPCRFQFTHPVWGATAVIAIDSPISYVSIHAPRVGCDYKIGSAAQTEEPFQFTHPVWGATRGSQWRLLSLRLFQFTHPVWGATFGWSVILI